MEIPPETLIFVRDFAIFLSLYFTVALSLNLENGYAGIPNFGKVFAVAGGAFVVGAIPGRIVVWLFDIGAGRDYITDNTAVVTDVNRILMGNPATSLAVFFITLAVAGVIGAALGLLSCYPAIRLREDYLAMTLLAMGEGIQVIGYNYEPIVKGSIGVLVPDPFAWAGDQRYAVIAIFIVSVCIALFLYVERTVRSPLGRTLKAIRDNEDVAKSLGKDVTSMRLKAIIVAATIASIVGALDAFKAGGVISTSYLRTSWTFWPWVIIILGGVGNNVGALAGTFIFTALRRFIDYYKGYLGPFLPFNVVWVDQLLLGMMLILVQLYRPEGLVHEKPTPTLGKDRLRKFINQRKKQSMPEKT